MANPHNRKNFSTYNQDYYTGAQTRIYFGGIWIDDVATIQYQSSHSKTPLYGYCDHQFRAVAKGQFLVQGNFSIAFKETGYLNVISLLIKNDNSGLNGITPSDSTKRIAKFMDYIERGYTPEQVLDISVADTKNSQDFEDKVEVLEDAIWGKETTPTQFKNRIPRSDELDYHKYTGTPGEETDIGMNGFDILITFGDYGSGSDTPEHTMISITEVHITGESMVIGTDGSPLGMNYTFFARGLNEKVSSAWPDRDKQNTEKKPEVSPIIDEINKPIINENIA